MARVLEGRNRATPEEMASFVDKYEQLEQEVLREKMSFMERCRRIRKAQSELLDDGKTQGLPKNVLKAVVKAREYARKADSLMEDLENDAQEIFKDIRQALGDFADLPLGAAAVEREETTDDDRTTAIVDAVKSDMTDDEQAAWEAAGAAAEKAAASSTH
ncbi:hypothetical protein [Rhizobium leguminosarum]|uniref:hypothetical protein n=1 Tax=Rhizobium leguminosarum TaxID=384 RepID=UPI0013BD0B5A|nr:hypothetical protein [Rhizobium leguminosarum]NEH72311.1 hypothetical protein [Rhizobium leguminosarum]